MASWHATDPADCFDPLAGIGEQHDDQIPPRFFANRTRVVANGVSLFFTAAFFSYIFLLTLFEHQVLHYSPLKGGLGYLPLGFGIGAGMGIGTALMPRVGVKPLIALSFLGAATGLVLTSQINVDGSYLGGVLPGMTVLALFCGLSFAPTEARLESWPVTWCRAVPERH